MLRKKLPMRHPKKTRLKRKLKIKKRRRMTRPRLKRRKKKVTSLKPKL